MTTDPNQIAQLQREVALLKAALKIGAMDYRRADPSVSHKRIVDIVRRWKAEACKFYPDLSIDY